MTMPEQKPGRSMQDVGTPREFIGAVEKRFGDIVLDLAAHEGNRICDRWLGPGGLFENAFDEIWHKHRGILWLNPPYGDIEEWAMRAAAESGFGARILMLIPAAVGTNYFAKWVWPFASVYALSPRLKFVGHESSYPKDLILCDYNRDTIPTFETWRWKP